MKSNLLKTFTSTLVLAFLSLTVFAQDNTVNIDGEDIGSWLKQHWMWVAGGLVVLLLLIGLLSSGKSRTRRTVVREEDVNGVVRTTTTEIKD